MICVTFDSSELKITKKTQISQVIENAILHNVEFKLKSLKNNLQMLQNSLDHAKLDILKICKDGKLCLSDSGVEISLKKGISTLKFTINLATNSEENPKSPVEVAFFSETDRAYMHLMTVLDQNNSTSALDGELLALIIDQFPEICK